VAPIITTTYTVTAFGDASCSDNSNNFSEIVAVVTIVPSVRYPAVTASPNIPIQLGIRNFGPGHTYLWNPPDGLNNTTIYNPVFNYDKQTEYLITITTDRGCTVEDTLLVRVAAQAPIINAGIYVPKAWSPNGDGHNDKLFPMTTNLLELKYFKIFNRWGQLVFETNVLGQGWDGIFNGKPQVLDTYIWRAEAVGLDGRYYKSSGSSVLLR
jgi:gliding motility-associated-like protein